MNRKQIEKLKAKMAAYYAAARETDPSTSDNAANITEKSGKAMRMRVQLVDAIRAHPGMTSVELGDLIGELRAKHGQTSRLPELEDAGYIFKGAKRLCSVQNQMCVTWWPVDPAKIDEQVPRFRLQPSGDAEQETEIE